MSETATITQEQVTNAKLLAQWANGWPELDPRRAYERLFQTTEGGYFLARQSPGRHAADIVPFSRDEARSWAAGHCDAMATARLFG